ncbi:MAG: hypothetical protein CM1200mP26_14310 [Acidimicrobiales bacterium]|nr:MAG: hypothetical protein CM1200mP26_14310 [Acidimicrobiales bacterium]
MAWGWRGPDRGDPRRHALAIGVHVLGGGLSSRLFQTVREDRGLAYSVFSSMATYSDAGVVSVYAGTAPERADELKRVVAHEVGEVAANGITEAERALLPAKDSRGRYSWASKAPEAECLVSGPAKACWVGWFHWTSTSRSCGQ